MKTKVVKFGDLKPGDKLVGSDGEVTKVVKVYDKHIPDKMYEIEMEDGEVIQASGNHLWYCETEKEIENKERYAELAKEYFENNNIPTSLEKDVEIPLASMINMFGSNITTQLFIERACRALGPSSVTPHMIVEGKFKDAVKEDVYNYSYNNLVSFLHKMKESVINNMGYFYFGEVRTTEEIAKLYWYNINVNIPHKGEMNNE